MKDPIILKDGETAHFSVDGEFSVMVKDGKAVVIPRTYCFIHVHEVDDGLTPEDITFIKTRGQTALDSEKK